MTNKPVVLNTREGAMARGGAMAIVLYRNHRGEVALRKIRPASLWKGETSWHTEKQWLLSALDAERNEPRTFAMSDILAWSLSDDGSLAGIRENPLVKTVFALASSEPREAEFNICSLCFASLPSAHVPSHHEPGCAWRMAKELVFVVERDFR